MEIQQAKYIVRESVKPYHKKCNCGGPCCSTKKQINEDYPSKLYKIEGYLITDLNKKNQNQILSDIRSLTGITTVNVEEYTPKVHKPGRLYNKLTIKIDPYPYVKNDVNGFDLEIVKKIIININGIKGVIKFKAEPKLVNIGI